MVETLGVQLETMLYFLDEHDLVPDWIDFYEQARRDNWNHRTILSKLEVAINDVYGKNYLKEWRTRFDKMLTCLR